MRYDGLSRLDTVYSSRTNNLATATREAVYDYNNNNGGKVSQMKLGNNIQTVNYTYSVRDFLKQISSAQFTQNLKYEDATVNPRYNGNIAQMSWNTAGNVGAYNFTYDKANRLTDAVSTTGADFSEKLISYDANGNILSLTRSTQAAIAYTYDANIPNRLNSVSGGIAAAYAYDANGNMTNDNTRGNFTYDYRNLPIAMALTNSGVTVNIQNQTLSGTYSNSSGDSVHIKDVTINAGSNVTIESKGGMVLKAGFSSNGATVSLKPGVSTAGSGGASYTGTVYAAYDAGGQRIKYLKGSTSSPQDGSRIYVRGSNGNVLAEYIRSGGNWNPDHWNVYGNGHIGKLNAAGQKFLFITDHLASNRVVLSSSGGVDSWANFMPFGKLANGSFSSNAPKEKFIGKIFDEESGFTDFGPRMLNSDIGRFMALDPLRQNYPQWSPYVYAGNMPVRFIDVNGMGPGEPAVIPIIPILIGIGEAVADYFAVAAFVGTAAGAAYLANEMTNNPTSTVLDNPGGGEGGVLTTEFPTSTAIQDNTNVNIPVGDLGESEGVQIDQGFQQTTTMEVRGGNKLMPDPNAQGAHTTFKTDPNTGAVTGHATWEPNAKNPTGFDLKQRTDITGSSHRNKLTGEEIPTPHTQGKNIPGGVRKATPNEIPKRNIGPEQ